MNQFAQFTYCNTINNLYRSSTRAAEDPELLATVAQIVAHGRGHLDGIHIGCGKTRAVHLQCDSVRQAHIALEQTNGGTIFSIGWEPDPPTIYCDLALSAPFSAPAWNNYAIPNHPEPPVPWLGLRARVPENPLPYAEISALAAIARCVAWVILEPQAHISAEVPAATTPTPKASDNEGVDERIDEGDFEIADGQPEIKQ